MNKIPEYYVLDTASKGTISIAEMESEVEGYNFRSAGYYDIQRFLARSSDPWTPPPVPFRLKTDKPSDTEIVPFYKGNAPLFRADLLEAIFAAGVDNLDVVDALLTEPKTGAVYKNFKLVNVVGLVDIVHKKNSKMMGIGDGFFPDAFAEGHFDGKKGDGFLMFRLSGGTSPIVIHERVRRSIEKHKIPNIYYQSSGNWLG
jgi:hypothetical protein